MSLKIYLSPSNQSRNLYSYGSTNEMEQCNKIAESAKKYLEYNGFQVKKAPKGQEMWTSINESNSWGSNIHVCIHTNAGGGKGCEVYVYEKASKQLKYAQPVYNEISAITQSGDRGIKTADFTEILNTTGIAVYCEVEFHDNSTTAKWIINNTDNIGKAIAKGLCKANLQTFKDPNDEQKPVQPEKPTQPEDAKYSVNDIVNFVGGKHYSNSNATEAAASNLSAGPAKITIISNGAKHPYHIIHTDSQSDVYGWVDASSISKNTSQAPTKEVFTLGEVVQFIGGKHYGSSNEDSKKGSSVGAGPAKITLMAEGSKHPYHIVHTDNTSSVYGWVDENVIKKITATTPSKTISVGSLVKVKENSKDYSGNALASFVYKNTYEVIEISGDRVVIGKNGAVTAAINKANLILV